MTSGNGNGSRIRDVDRDSKALWAAMEKLEQGMERRMKSFTEEIRQLLTERPNGEVVTPMVPRVARSEFSDIRDDDSQLDRFSHYSDFDSDEGSVIHRGNRLGGHRLRGHNTQPRVNPGMMRNSKFRFKMDGYLHIEDFLDWLDNVENYFQCMTDTEDMRVKLVSYKLKGGAHAWWKQIQHGRVLEGNRPISSWNRMKQMLKQMLKQRFLPTNYAQTLYLHYLNCRQGSRTVKDMLKNSIGLGLVIVWLKMRTSRLLGTWVDSMKKYRNG
ncbi:hypothetical protein LWI28_007215 [Acer negundo]|uniref:Retrotransposon gag domain-containing protein n=1 Tax=Acer negundo TaxID=4023 RepID=A0AAD5NXB4_ACENE|nr:hypothetical protein LWI28_007215 [Acer negundo]